MLSKVQELKLIALCVTVDDRRAFGQLVEAYADDVRRLLLTLTRGDVSLVDDLAQETFLKAYLAIRSFEGVARFRTWLYRIAYNEFISYTRRSRRFEPVDNLADEPADEEYDEPISDATLSDALMRLPEAQRIVTQLFYFDGFSIARIATVTGMPEGSVKSYLSRARKRLAVLLEKNRY